MLNVLHRRAPWARVVINPVRVQGAGASVEIAAAVREFQGSAGLPAVDIIVVCRGGGSAEDLWEFNEEAVARAIFASKIPVVSAIGHEIDFTICDFVADLRAPTPSAAAELIVPDAKELDARFARMGAQLQRSAETRIEQWKSRLALASRGVQDPRRLVEESFQRVDLLEETLRRNMLSRVALLKQAITSFRAVLYQHRPDQVTELKRQQLGRATGRLSEQMRAALESSRARLRHADGLLRVLAPQATLERGFSITTDETGQVVRSISQTRAGMVLRTRVVDGVATSRVETQDASLNSAASETGTVPHLVLSKLSE